MSCFCSISGRVGFWITTPGMTDRERKKKTHQDEDGDGGKGDLASLMRYMMEESQKAEARREREAKMFEARLVAAEEKAERRRREDMLAAEEKAEARLEAKKLRKAEEAKKMEVKEKIKEEAARAETERLRQEQEAQAAIRCERQMALLKLRAENKDRAAQVLEVEQRRAVTAYGEEQAEWREATRNYVRLLYKQKEYLATMEAIQRREVEICQAEGRKLRAARLQVEEQLVVEIQEEELVVLSEAEDVAQAESSSVEILVEEEEESGDKTLEDEWDFVGEDDNPRKLWELVVLSKEDEMVEEEEEEDEVVDEEDEAEEEEIGKVCRVRATEILGFGEQPPGVAKDPILPEELQIVSDDFCKNVCVEPFTEGELLEKEPRTAPVFLVGGDVGTAHRRRKEKEKEKEEEQSESVT